MCDLVQRLIAANETNGERTGGSDIFYAAAERISFLEKQLEENKDDKFEVVTVDAKALKDVLSSLKGPSYLIRELHVIDNLPGNEGSISKLVRQYNEAIELHNANATNT